MNHATATNEELKKRHTSLIEARDKGVGLTTDELEQLRTLAVELAKQVKAGKARAEAELDKVNARRAELEAPYRNARGALKLELRRIEAELASREHAALRAEFGKLNEDALTAKLGELAGERRELARVARAVQAVLDERAAKKRVKELAASLSDAEKHALLQTIEAEGIEPPEARKPKGK